MGADEDSRMNRLKAMWHVLWGKPIMYRVDARVSKDRKGLIFDNPTQLYLIENNIIFLYEDVT